METTRQIAEHVETIAKHEQKFLASRTLAERVADRVATFAGRITFVFLHLVWFSAWILWNSAVATKMYRFDRYPYPLFDTVLALEAILLASFILMRQTSLARRSDERDHLMLQILLLTEKETSAIVRMNQNLAAHLGLRDIFRDPEISEMGQPTSIDQLAQTIQEKLSAE
jgi:uncharacterized membrane protein